MASPTLNELPRVDRVLSHPALALAARALGHGLVTELVRLEIDAARREILAGERLVAPTENEIAEGVGRSASAIYSRRTRRVINATGILVHTNLGRAPLSEAARQAVVEASRGYGSLEMDLSTGKRGGRAGFAESAIRALAGAEEAFVVNNCAAAVLLVLATLASRGGSRHGGPGIIVSRGELIEIGGSFRVPSILEESGARLVEVGTTNRTHLADYEEAFERHPDIAGILRVHQGNFRMTGFVERPTVRELAELAKRRGVPLVKDLGGGALVELADLGEHQSSRGFAGEPTVAACVRQGADLVCFSGDKVLGGPQAGIIVGRRALVDRARKHPLARALRLGRLPLAALEATLASYLCGRIDEVPVLAMVRRPLDLVEARAERWCAVLVAAGADAHVVETESEMGGGALADRHISSRGVVIRDGSGPDALASRLRSGDPAIVARVVDGALVLDARTVLDGEDEVLLEGVVAALARAV